MFENIQRSADAVKDGVPFEFSVAMTLRTELSPKLSEGNQRGGAKCLSRALIANILASFMIRFLAAPFLMPLVFFLLLSSVFFFRMKFAQSVFNIVLQCADRF
jgi:hypothetical protein